MKYITAIILWIESFRFDRERKDGVNIPKHYTSLNK